jgi:hypothetical protein
MGEVIAFKRVSGGLRLRAAPTGDCAVVIITGLWQERPKENPGETKRTRCGPGKRPSKGSRKPAGRAQEQNISHI